MDVDQRIVKFIVKHHVLTLATAADNVPHCSNMFYAYLRDRNIFVFTSEHKTIHASQALLNTHAAASVVLETRTVGKLQGLQLHGEVYPAKVEDRDVRGEYIKRFPYAMVADLSMWIFEPHWMKFTDNTLGFGKKLIWQKDGFK